LPWDLDDVFRPQPQIRSPDTPLVSSCVGSGGTCAPIPLGVNIRDDAEIRPRYLEALCNVANGTGFEDEVVSQLDRIDARIRPVIAQEVAVLWQPRGLDPLDADTPGTYAAEVERLRDWIPERVQAVRRMITDEGVPCQSGCTAGSSIRCTTTQGVIERACVGGHFTPCVSLEPTGISPLAEDSEAAGGCSCRTQPTRHRAVWAFGLLMALSSFRRRRRRHSAASS
jgi:MYXO-CTERM domain-containing protein